MALNRKTFKKAAAAVADTNLPSGYFNTVTYTGNGGTQRIGGYINRGAVFNGSSSYIQADGIFSSSPSVMSASVWFKTTVDGNILDIGDSSVSTAQNRIFFSSGLLYVSLNGGGGGFASTSATGLQDGNWHHIVAVWDDGTVTNGIKMYIDGATTPTAQGNSTQSFISALNLFIGANDNRGSSGSPSIRQYFNGTIDQVRIFNKALSSSEVTTLYGETYASTTISTTDIFDDNSGVALYQLDGNANDTGGVSGYIGEGAIFNGSSSYIDTSVSVLPADNHTVSMWIYHNSLKDGCALYTQYRGSVTGRHIVNSNASGGIQINTSSTNSLSSITATPFTTGTWQHLVVTKSSTAGYVVYIDGSSIGTWSSTDNIITDQSTQFGGDTEWGGDHWLNGSIDQVRIYSKALSSSEVTTLYGETASSNITISDLVAYYPMEGTSLDQEGSYHGTDTNVEYNYSGTATNVTYQEATNFSPDLVWVKSRSLNVAHALFDSVRGAQKYISPSTTGAEGTYSTVLTSFDSNGFTVGSNAGVNFNSDTYAAWCFNAGTDAAVSNTDGSITSTVKANQDAGFSIVKWTGNGTNGATIGHGLSNSPEIIITKGLSNATSWIFGIGGVSGFGVNDYMTLQTTAAKSSTTTFYQAYGTDTFTVGVSSANEMNKNSSNDYIAYCFHSVDGIQKVGSYTGTGASGNMIETGFEPAFLLIKQTNTSGSNWNIIDNKRDTANPRDVVLWADSSGSESTASVGGVYDVNFLSNGFSLENTYQPFNASGGTYIYLAIAADPDTTTPTVEDSFQVVTYTGNRPSTQSIDVGFKPDLVWVKNRDSSSYPNVLTDSVRGNTKYLQSDSSQAELTTAAGITSFDSNGFSLGADGYFNGGASGANNEMVAWCWKAGDHDDNLPQINTEGSIDSIVSVNDAAGFSIVKYTGNSGATKTIGHGLSSAPEMIILKNISDAAQHWSVYHSATGNGQVGHLNLSNAFSASGDWGSTTPTSTIFTIGSGDARTNSNGEDHISYCFTSITGYQKIGSYTGTGATGNSVTTGFQPRFVMIKSSSNAEPWFILDAARDTTNPRDNRLMADSSAAEDDGSVHTVDFTSTGFTANGTVANGTNGSGATYIYLAIK